MAFGLGGANELSLDPKKATHALLFAACLFVELLNFETNLRIQIRILLVHVGRLEDVEAVQRGGDDE